jgi:hypothetical protein
MTTFSKYRWSWVSVLLAALAVMATAQTNSTVKSSSQPVAKTEGSAKASSPAKASPAAGNAGVATTPSPAQGGTNGPMDPGNASMSAPPGWVPPNHNAPQVQNQQSSKTGSKAHAKKGNVANRGKK